MQNISSPHHPDPLFWWHLWALGRMEELDADGSARAQPPPIGIDYWRAFGENGEIQCRGRHPSLPIATIRSVGWIRRRY
jgi:hypothetical protein